MPDYNNNNVYQELIKGLQDLASKINEKEKELEKISKEKLDLLDILNKKNEINIQNLNLLDDLELKINNLEKENKFLKKEIEIYKEKINKNESQINQYKNKEMLFNSRAEIYEKKIKILNEDNARLKIKANYNYYEHLRSLNIASKIATINKKLLDIIKANNLEDEIKKL